MAIENTIANAWRWRSGGSLRNRSTIGGDVPGGLNSSLGSTPNAKANPAITTLAAVFAGLSPWGHFNARSYG